MTRAPKVCAEPGCPNTAEPGDPRCAQHKRPAWHGSGKGRGGRPWRRLRDSVLARDRHRCRDCGDPATEVHHLDGIAAGGDQLPHLSRLLSLCTACHDRRTAEDRAR